MSYCRIVSPFAFNILIHTPTPWAPLFSALFICPAFIFILSRFPQMIKLAYYLNFLVGAYVGTMYIHMYLWRSDSQLTRQKPFTYWIKLKICGFTCGFNIQWKRFTFGSQWSPFKKANQEMYQFTTKNSFSNPTRLISILELLTPDVSLKSQAWLVSRWLVCHHRKIFYDDFTAVCFCVCAVCGYHKMLQKSNNKKKTG